jgi:hypothetical protein
MLRCPNCFQHKWLKEKVAELSKETGECDCCESEDVPVLEASELGGYFDNLLSMYVVADSFESGESIVSLIQWHWQVFDEDTLDEDTQADLLEDIANSDWDDDDGEDPLDAHELYQPLGAGPGNPSLFDPHAGSHRKIRPRRSGSRSRDSGGYRRLGLAVFTVGRPVDDRASIAVRFPLRVWN